MPLSFGGARLVRVVPFVEFLDGRGKKNRQLKVVEWADDPDRAWALYLILRRMGYKKVRIYFRFIDSTVLPPET